MLAGVSSFGMGGTNCHVALSEPPSSTGDQSSKKIASGDPAGESPLPGQVPLALSARSDDALRAQAGRLAAHLDANPQLALEDVGLSLSTTRSVLQRRAVVLGEDREQLRAGLAALASGDEAEGIAHGTARGEQQPVFLFPGHGSQWQGMALELAENSPLFAGRLAECEAALDPYIDFSVREVLEDAAGSPSLKRIDVVQPALFAVMVSLARLWEACGVKPAAVVGHSQGEVAAAHVAGGLDLERRRADRRPAQSAAREQAGSSGMVSVALPAGELDRLLEPFAGKLAVAAHNGPASKVVSGERRALDRLLEQCAGSGIRARGIAGAAFGSHSPLVEPLRDELLDLIGEISPHSGEVPFYSTVTGGQLDTAELDPDYWYRNLRETVRFEQATRELLDGGQRLLVEVSPHPIFTAAVEETIEQALDDPEEAVALTTLRRDQGGPQRFALSLGEAHNAGVPVDWVALFPGAGRVKLPTYPFQRRRCWLDVVPVAEGVVDLAKSEPPAETGEGQQGPLATELAGLAEGERADHLLGLVRTQVAAVLGHDSAADVDPIGIFKELGFDSTAAADLRKRLKQATGVRLGATAVFDHPNSTALANHLLELATGVAGKGKRAIRVRASEEPIAILGMACRYPGGVDSPEELWQLVAEGGDAIGEFPADRGWDPKRIFDPDPDRPGASYACQGGFVTDPAGFDAGFFGIAPREALAMDPQQRVLLEAAWEALEAAGLDPSALRGSPTGVFAGISSQDYTSGLRGSEEELKGYRLTGSLTSVASGRVAYALGLEGPAITIDTACSSSLVALHLAAQALQAGECSLALAGGATILGSPGIFTEFSRQRGLAADGRCKAFAEAADGTGFSEGAGVLVLERLSEAQRNGHPVLATIRGSAVNQDGASNGLTAPNGPSQEQVIRQALANAQLAPGEVDAVEAHGTGTTLGDPIEATALLATYGRDREAPLRLGSVKSNIGHTQAAAGAAGVIKTVMAMRAGVLPKTLHVDAPSAKVDWDLGEIELLTEAEPWEPNGRPRRAGVSSFGISGTNAHLILEEAPPSEPREAAGGAGESRAGASAGLAEARPPGGLVPLALSARSEQALAGQARRLAAHLRESPQLGLTDIAFSLATTRTAFEHRAVALGRSREELLEGLDALGQGERAPGVADGRAAPGAKLAYLFTGQGSQRLGMGEELQRTSGAFREAFGEVCEQLDRHLETPLGEIVFGEDAALLDLTTYAQPALFALQVSLFRMLTALGLEPRLLAGHSIGEISAAHVAGVFSLADAAKLVTARGRLMGALPEGGAMLAVEATEQEARASIAGKEQELSIAAINGPTAVVLSGTSAQIERAEDGWKQRGRKTKRLAVSHAFHSPLIEPMLTEFEAVAGEIAYRPPRIPIVSNSSGELLSAEQATDPAYWVAHVREPVRFADALATLRAQGASACLELGPDPVLTAMAGEALEGDAVGGGEAVALVPTLRQGAPEGEAVTGALAGVHAAGIAVEWPAFFAGSGAKRVPLPTYAFQRQRYWLAASSGAGNPTAIGQADAEHPLLGAVIEEPQGTGLTLTGRLSLATHPWLAEHVAAGAVLFPGAAFIELALRAGEAAGMPYVQELTLSAPLEIPERGAVQLQVSVGEAPARGAREILIHSRVEDGEGGPEGAAWSLNATGRLSAEAARLPVQPASWPPDGAEALDVGDLYERLADAGLSYGPAFQGLAAAWRAGETIYAEVSLPEEHSHEARRFALHPALLDASLHGVALLAADGDEPQVPFSWADVCVETGGASRLRVALVASPDGVSLSLADDEGTPIGNVGSLAMRPLGHLPRVAAAKRSTGLLEVEWRDASPGESGERAELRRLSGDPSQGASSVAREALQLIQRWLAEEQQGRLAIITEGAVATVGTESPDPATAAAWGLVRSAQSEHPGRIVLIDTDGSEASEEAIDGLLGEEAEPQLALRNGRALAPRARPVTGDGGTILPPAGPWRLDAPRGNTLEDLALVPDLAAAQPLEPSEVRIRMRAAALNFRDVLIALGHYPGEAAIGSEGAGEVVAVGSAITDLAPGDRVMGLIDNAFASLAIAERSRLSRLPGDWTWERGAAVPIAFLTAHYALVDLAGLEAGERVLIHAGAGGVGMAAIQIAQGLGAEVFATASPSKWKVLQGMGVAEERIASSRDPSFKEKLFAATGGAGVDVVLNSLTGDLVDASLDLLARGGRFLEMGKADVRDSAQIAREHPGVEYSAFDLGDAGAERIGQLLEDLLGLFEQGALHHSPIVAWDVRRAPEAFRHLREGRNIGKVVLEIPRPVDPERTILVTGASGGLGSLVARHLVADHGARHLLLASRRGIEAEGAGDLKAVLEEMGASVTLAACDVSSRTQLGELLDSVPAAHPLGAVIHAAGVLDDATIEGLRPEQIERAFAPKAAAATHLDELTRGMDLSAFVLFSSAAGVLGNPGQGGYAAANAYLDALAQKRCAEGLPATAIAWGLWQRPSGMTAGLSEADLVRMRRSGIDALTDEHGLDLFDQALVLGQSQAGVLALAPNPGGLRTRAGEGSLPPILSGLVRSPKERGRVGRGTLSARLASLPEDRRGPFVLELVRSEVAAVLGHGSADAIAPDKAFKELGFDSLAAVELRNRLRSTTGLRLPSTVVFNRPTAAELAAYLLAEASATGASRVAVRAQTSDEPIAIVGMACRYPGGVSSPEQLWQLVAEERDGISEFPGDRGWDLERLFNLDPDEPDTSYTRHGGFLAAVGEFDAEFFGIGPREALAMDPQQRLLMETSWEALEAAGVDPASVRGERAGIFAGVSSQDYTGGLRGPETGLEGFRLTGSSTSVASGRIAYALGLVGPAITLDTACSSSLVAMHLAAQALRGGECSLALAGGATVLASPGMFTEFSRQRGLAADGRCKAFAEAADGTAWSEGVGVLVLERLSEAQANGHPVLATIRGTAINQDGASNGLTAPNGTSQEEVIRQALTNAGLAPGDVDAVEAHGTGTTLGDPIEAAAIIATYGQQREAPLKLGSIKSNIGHGIAAAGVAGVIKTVMAMREGILPKTLHVDAPSSHVDWEAGAVELLTEAEPWQANGETAPCRRLLLRYQRHQRARDLGGGASRRAPRRGARGISRAPAPPVRPLGLPVPLLLSAKSQAALCEQAARLATHLSEQPRARLSRRRLLPADQPLDLRAACRRGRGRAQGDARRLVGACRR